MPGESHESLRQRVRRAPKVCGPEVRGADRDGFYWTRTNYQAQRDRRGDPRIVPVDKVVIGIVAGLVPRPGRPAPTLDNVRAALSPVLGAVFTRHIVSVRRAAGGRGVVCLGFDNSAFAMEARPMLSQIALALADFGCKTARLEISDERDPA